MDKWVEICKSLELTGLQIKALENDGKIHAIVKYNNKYDKVKKALKQKNSGAHLDLQRPKTEGDLRAFKKTNVDQCICNRCGTTHPIRQCPAFGKICKKCGKRNHFAVRCNSKEIKTIECASENNFFINMMNINKIQNKNYNWIEIIEINKNHKMEVKLDTGADSNVISEKEF